MSELVAILVGLILVLIIARKLCITNKWGVPARAVGTQAPLNNGDVRARADEAQIPQVYAGAPEQDNWETERLLGSPGEMQLDLNANIHYRDGRGLETRRDIHIRAMYPYGDDYAILAFCRLRQQHRSFLVSRIQRFVDLATGQVIADVASYLTEVYARSPRGATDIVLKARNIEAGILTFIARASGSIGVKERASILHFLQMSSEHPLDDHYLSGRLREIEPNSGEYRTLLREAGKLPPDQRKALMAAVEAMEKARSKMDESTAAAIAVARRFLTPATERSDVTHDSAPVLIN